MISVIIPTLNAESTLAHTLTALVPAVVDGIVQEAILVDGGSTDQTRSIAEAAGTHLIEARPGRGTQLDAGASHARGDWLLFLHADTVLDPGWAGRRRASWSGSPAAGAARRPLPSNSRWTTAASCRA